MFLPIIEQDERSSGVTRTRIRVIGVTFSEILIKRKEILVRVIRVRVIEVVLYIYFLNLGILGCNCGQRLQLMTHAVGESIKICLSCTQPRAIMALDATESIMRPSGNW